MEILHQARSSGFLKWGNTLPKILTSKKINIFLQIYSDICVKRIFFGSDVLIFLRGICSINSKKKFLDCISSNKIYNICDKDIKNYILQYEGSSELDLISHALYIES